MSDYLFISILALYCYLFFLLTFLSAKRNKLINQFIIVLINMVFWTGGSLLMRSMAWPSYEFWYHVSVIGIWLLPCTYFRFIREYSGEGKKTMDTVWLILLIAGSVINAFTNFFLAPPEIVRQGENVQFVYQMGWPVVIMYGLCAVVVVRIFQTIYAVYKRDRAKATQLMPLFAGIILMFAGNLGIYIFNGFPLDIASGVLNAVLMFCMLYAGRVFKLTLLGSKRNCYFLAMGISVIVFFNIAQELSDFIRNQTPFLLEYIVMIVAVLTMLCTWALYALMKALFDRLFIHEEQKQNEKLAEYTMFVSKSLELNEIYRALVNVITETLHAKKTYICVGDQRGIYKIAYSTSPLDDNRFSMQPDHPLICWLKENSGCLLLSDFKRTIRYKSMWEEEKRRLDDLRVSCFLPLKDGEELVGVVMLGEKNKKQKNYTLDDISFLNSLESVSSIALKNSRLYERAHREARTDDLTGLYNRKYFYETLEETYQNFKNSALSLIIFNVDDFKLYNQLYGNYEGDLALCHIAQIIKGTVGESGSVARYSAKEFAVLLPGCDIYSAQNLAENICKQIRNMNNKSEEAYLKSLTVSCGICAIPYGASNPRELVQNADQAVYHVKHSGKNGIMVYTEGIVTAKRTLADVEQHKSMYSEYAPTIYALTAAIDAKDHYTFQHCKNVAYYAETLGRALNLQPEIIEILREAALLHDIGKIGVSEQILNKQGRLTDEEYEAMKGHVEYSVGIIRHLPSMDYVIPAVIGHHERYDGKGYPRRISGKDIPLAARILCIADSFDAMISKRCYKPEMSLDYALSELQRGAGTQFDPELAQLFVEMVLDKRLTPVMSE